MAMSERKVHVLGVFIALTVLGLSGAWGQSPHLFTMSKEEHDAHLAKISARSTADWQRMVDLIGIRLPDSLPPPIQDPRRPVNTFQKEGSPNWYDREGNTYARSAWGTWNNYSEAKANPFPRLPDPLRLDDGRRVSTEDMWWMERREEIINAFNREIFGEVPSNIPAIRWSVLRTQDTTIGNVAAVTKGLSGRLENALDTNIRVEIQATLTTPAAATRPVPVLMEFGFVFPPGFHFPGMTKPEGPTWQEQVLQQGWGYVVYVPTSVQPDHGAGLTEGIIGLVNKGRPRDPGDWGALRAWAWGASRVMDYLETDETVDAAKVGIEGLSRYGKAVLVAMAYDQRFAIALVGSSGKGGATLYRRDYGESMGNICSTAEYHWFAGTFLRYVVRPDTLPVDSHELIALCAPRPVFISCGSPEIEGRWVDAKGQFDAALAASPVFALLGKKGLGATAMPSVGIPLVGGDLAFRQHKGGHTNGPNWPYFLRFGRRYFAAPGASGPR